MEIFRKKVVLILLHSFNVGKEVEEAEKKDKVSSVFTYRLGLGLMTNFLLSFFCQSNTTFEHLKNILSQF